MSAQANPTEQLVDALIEQTASGQISWEPADVLQTAFVARRNSGTVTLEVPGLGTAQGIAKLMTQLVVRNSRGDILERLSASNASASLLGGSRAAARLPILYDEIVRQRAHAQDEIRKLVDEFSH